jgi:hypothetical protein
MGCLVTQQSLMSPKNSIEALIDLLCVFYVFYVFYVSNIKYSPEVKPALLFLQTPSVGHRRWWNQKEKDAGYFHEDHQEYPSKKKRNPKRWSEKWVIDVIC